LKLKQRTIRVLCGVAITLLMLVPVLTGERFQLIERLELDLYDLRLQQSLTKEQDPRIVIVDIDEKSLAAEGRWPWGRDRIAVMISQLLNHYGVAVVGFDMGFPEPTKRLSVDDMTKIWQPGKSLAEVVSELDPDGRLAEVISGQPVVLGYVFDQSQEDLRKGVLGEPWLVDERIESLEVPEARGVIANIRRLQQASDWAGFFDNPSVDPDGVYRRVPVLQHYQNGYYPSLALAMLMALMDSKEITPLIEQDITGRLNALVGIDAAGIQIPTDQSGAVLVPYRGYQGSFPYVSATDVISAKADLSQLEGAIVLIGTSAAGLLDLRVTPMQNRYPGVEVHANIIAGMLDEQLRSKPDYILGVELLQLLLCGLILSLVLPRVSVVGAFVTTSALIILVTAFNYYAWQELLIVVSLAYTVILCLILFLFLQLTGYFFEVRNRRQLKSTFGQYVPPELVDSLSLAGTRLSMEGDHRYMTVFFSDIRGFTQLSETLSPAQLTDMMNIYLTAMTKIIHQHGGTVDKYIGDAVMAFWGAPLEDPDHATHAVQAAIAMRQKMPEVNARLAEHGLPELKIGMGLHCGYMNVGNMGSEFRVAYTVMGDAVNLASRLEGLTKFYGTDLIISEELANNLKAKRVLELDLVRVKGRQEPVHLYTVMDEEQAEFVSAVDAFLLRYREGAWEQAAVLLQGLRQEYPEQYLLNLYFERMSDNGFQPPKGWQPVFSHTEK